MARDRYSESGGNPLVKNWEEVVCPICLDFPHNGVLLQCACFEKGCRAFVCDTDNLHSNCLDRFKTACGMPAGDDGCKPSCPLCRGEVSGWVVVGEAREYLDEKRRCCDEERCRFAGTYSELRRHARAEHPHARPSEIDPARRLDWENFQQSSEIIDVLSTIHSEVPRGVVLGDYVIEYGGGGDGDDSGDEFDDFPAGGEEGSWWTSCILYQVFDNLRGSRSRRRSRRGSRRPSYDHSNSDEGSVTSVEFAEYRVDEIDDDFITATAPAPAPVRTASGHRSSRRRRSRFYDS